MIGVLFADGTAAEAIGWTGVAIAVISMLGTAINALFSYLDKRDTRENDARLTSLERDLAEANKKTERCEDLHKNCDQNLAKLRAEKDAEMSVQQTRYTKLLQAVGQLVNKTDKIETQATARDDEDFSKLDSRLKRIEQSILAEPPPATPGG